MFRYNIAISFIAAGMSGYIMWTSSQMKALERTRFGPGAWPYFLGTVLLVISVALLIETLVKWHLERRKKPSAETDKPGRRPIEFTSPGLIAVYKLCGLLVVFAILLRYTNFLFAVFVFIPSGMWILGSRKKTTLAALAVGVPLSIYVIFAYLLKITLP